MERRAAYINRTNEVRKQKITLAIVFIIVFLVASCIFTARTYAGNYKKENTNSVKKYKSVMIYSGDTLESLAAEYMSTEYSSVNAYVKEVISINGITSDSVLIPGNHIIVPYYECIEESPSVVFQLATN